MEGRMHNKRQIILSELHKSFIEKKDVRIVRCKQLHGWHSIKELSGKRLNCAVQAFFFSDFVPAITFLFPAVQSTLRQRIFYSAKCLKRSQEYIVQCKTWRLPKFWKPQKALYLTVRIEGIARADVWAVCH